MNEVWLGWIVLPLCLGLSALLSGMEAGVFALSRLRIRQQMRAGRPSAKILHGYLENPENFLWTIFVGNTLANFAVLGWIFSRLYAEWMDVPVVLGALFAVLVCGFYIVFDLLPKMLFRAYPNRLCLAWAPVFRFIHLGLRPLVAAVEACSRWILRRTGGQAFTGRLFGNREELRLIMQESAQAFTWAERTMIARVLDLSHVTVRPITRALADTVTVNTTTPVGEVLALARTHGVTRLPVWEERDGQRRIAGLILVDRLLFEGEPDVTRPARDFLTPAVYLDEDVRLETALRRLQRAGQPLAVVLDRNQRELGIISLEDILRTIFGEVKL